MNEKAELGIDGNCGFALLGENLQEGEAEFFEVPEPKGVDEQCYAAKKALYKLRERLNKPNLGHFYGSLHPFGGK